MKQIILVCISFVTVAFCNAQNPVGKWKKISHVSSYDGQTFDSHQALLQQRPCAANIVYEVNADASFRLNAVASGCDESYKKIQEKLYSKTKWKVENGVIHISATNFAVSQSYRITITGSKMIWVGTDNQGTITYQKL